MGAEGYTRDSVGCIEPPDSSTSNAPERSSLIFPIAPRPDGQNCLPRRLYQRICSADRKNSAVSQATGIRFSRVGWGCTIKGYRWDA